MFTTWFNPRQRGAVDRLRATAYVPRQTSATRTPRFKQGFLFTMLLFQFLLVVHAVIAASLVTVILLQRSEGGGLGMGGSPSGLMSARGAADFLTRATSVLATLFVVFSIVLAVLAASGKSTNIDTTLAKGAGAAQTAPAPVQPTDGPAFSAGARSAIEPTGNTAAPASNGSVPLAQ